MTPAADQAPTLVIRADATATIGTGHLRRCLALVAAWRERGGVAVVCGACDNDALYEEVGRVATWRPMTMNTTHPNPSDLAEFQAALETAGGRTIAVVDGYSFDEDYLSAVHRSRPLLVVDDMANLVRYDADIVLNQNIHASQLRYETTPGAVCLLGTRFALLRREFAESAQTQDQVSETARRVLITLGGSDPTGFTASVIEALDVLDDLEITAVVGSTSPCLDRIVASVNRRPHVSLVVDSSAMSAAMAWADLAIAGAGSTCWELAFMGLPAVLVSLAANQEPLAVGMEAAGAAVNAGRSSDLDPQDLCRIVETIIGDAPRRRSMRDAGRRLVDGRGADRVVDALMSLCS